MNTPTRRDFFTYVAGATLASALPVPAQTNKDAARLRLVVDLIGPMAFKKGTRTVDVWLPKLEKIDKHEAGISTPAIGIVLTEKSYTITLPGWNVPLIPPTPHTTPNCKIYQSPHTSNSYSDIDSYIHLELPLPKYIVAVNPVRARIFPTAPAGQSSKADCLPYAVGLRFIYDKADAATLTASVDGHGPIPFGSAPFETQLNMTIGYAPYNLDHAKAIPVFNALSKLVGLDLQVEFQCVDQAANSQFEADCCPFHNCHSPNILLI